MHDTSVIPVIKQEDASGLFTMAAATSKPGSIMMRNKISAVYLSTLSAVLLGACQALSALELPYTHPQDVMQQPSEVSTLAPGHAPQEVASESKSIPGFVLDIRRLSGLADIMPELYQQRVLFVGESHTDYGHHLNQLEVIQRLHEADLDIAIGMEFFQQPYQEYLDAYIAGGLDEKTMLAKTEYFDRWSYDYRLYQPILRYAREHGIPLVALNIPGEISRKVYRSGIDSLSEDEKAQIPAQRDESDAAYRSYVQDMFERHAPEERREFENFFQAQLLWDEGMAERASQYLAEHPEKRMVVLAGSGHLINDLGIPNRLKRRQPMPTLTLLPLGDLRIRPGMSDFLVNTPDVQLPPIGRMGVILLDDGKEGVVLQGLVKDSPAEKAGLNKGDRILSLQGHPMNTVAEIKIALLDRQPGDKVTLRVRREHFLFGVNEFALQLELGE